MICISKDFRSKNFVININRLKKEAKVIRDELGLKLIDAMDIVSYSYGYDSYRSLFSDQFWRQVNGT